MKQTATTNEPPCITDINKINFTDYYLQTRSIISPTRTNNVSPPTSEAGVWFPAWPQVGKLVVVCRWSAVSSTEP